MEFVRLGAEQGWIIGAEAPRPDEGSEVKVTRHGVMDRRKANQAK